MEKTNMVLLAFLMILILSSVFFFISYFNNGSSKFYVSNYSYRGVKLIPENAPPLSNLFNGINNDPHNAFHSSAECLKCHIVGMEIKGKIRAPRIIHNVQENCIGCHVLADR